MSEIKLRYLTVEDKADFISANDAEWGEFIFAHYWDFLTNNNFNKHISFKK